MGADKEREMGKRTKKAGICGKYGTRYGASLRKVEEDGDHPARQVPVQLLWQGLREEGGCRHLEVQVMQEGGRWWHTLSTHQLSQQPALPFAACVTWSRHKLANHSF